MSKNYRALVAALGPFLLTALAAFSAAGTLGAGTLTVAALEPAARSS